MARKSTGGMACPACGERETFVLDSRTIQGNAVIRRRRECSACQQRFSTYEMVAKRDWRRRRALRLEEV